MHYIPEVKGIEEVGGFRDEDDDIDEPLILRHKTDPIPQAYDGDDDDGVRVR